MKKLTAILLAVLMLALPVLGSAATVDEMLDNARNHGKPVTTVVSFEPADLSALLGSDINTIYTDVLNALGLTAYTNGEGNDQGGISVSLQDADVLTIDLAMDDEGTAYLNSNFLGTASIAVAANEWQTLLEKLIDLMAAEGEISSSEAAELKAQLAAAFSGELVSAEMMAIEDAFADIDFSGILAKGMEIAAKAQTAAVTEQPAGCDPAATVVSLTLTAEDVTAIYTALADALRKSEGAMSYITAQLGGEMTAEELLTGMVDAVAQAMTMVEGGVPVAIYLDAEGSLVCFTMDMAMKVDGSALKMALAYNRVTADQGVFHTVTGQIMENDSTILDSGFTYLNAGDASLVTMKFEVEYDDDEFEVTADAVFDEKNLDMSMKMDFDVDGEEGDVELTAVVTNKDSVTTADVNMSVTADDETVGIALLYNDEQTPGDAEASAKGDLTLNVTYEGVTMGVKADYATACTVGESTTANTSCNVSVAALGQTIPVLTVNTTTTIGGDAKASVASADAVHVAAMTDDELTAYGTQIVQTAQVELIELAQHLPVSVLQMMMQ